ncbi:MAG: DUF6390 family protein [bacterium]
MLKKSQLLLLNNKGILRCAQYAFMPNKFNFCGPDKNKDLFYYCKNNESDKGLNSILSGFQVLYPYLKLIAYSNKIKDVFDERVVEAYWIGNQLLDNINKSTLYWHLRDEQQLKNKLNKKLFKKVIDKIAFGAKPHHSFHVLNIWKRTGNLDIMHTLNSMDLCRISWGRIKKINKSEIEVDYQPLVLENDNLKLGNLVPQKVLYEINGSGFLKNPKIGQVISFHWGFACEVLNEFQVKNLEKYTKENIKLCTI